jgi:hypothetical protein
MIEGVAWLQRKIQNWAQLTILFSHSSISRAPTLDDNVDRAWAAANKNLCHHIIRRVNTIRPLFAGMYLLEVLALRAPGLWSFAANVFDRSCLQHRNILYVSWIQPAHPMIRSCTHRLCIPESPLHLVGPPDHSRNHFHDLNSALTSSRYPLKILDKSSAALKTSSALKASS